LGIPVRFKFSAGCSSQGHERPAGGIRIVKNRSKGFISSSATPSYGGRQSGM
jgi:hypothetical protein